MTDAASATPERPEIGCLPGTLLEVRERQLRAAMTQAAICEAAWWEAQQQIEEMKAQMARAGDAWAETAAQWEQAKAEYEDRLGPVDAGIAIIQGSSRPDLHPVE